MKAIVVADQNWAIGSNGGLLIHLPGDLNYFKQKTLGKTIIMGRKTLDSLPGKKPLPGRKTIVLTKSQLQGDFVTCNSVDSVLEELRHAGTGDEAFVAGGQQIYEQFLPFCDEIYVTKLAVSFEAADSFFPDLEKSGEFFMEALAEPVEENGISYQFVVYRRK